MPLNLNKFNTLKDKFEAQTLQNVKKKKKLIYLEIDKSKAH